MGLFPSHKDAPRVVATNGMMIPNYSKPDDWEKFNALGSLIVIDSLVVQLFKSVMVHVCIPALNVVFRLSVLPFDHKYVP